MMEKYHGPTPAAELARPGDNEEKGVKKMDFGKAPVYKLFVKYFPRAIIAVSYVSEYGLRKYNPGGDGTGWKYVRDGINRYGDADFRHDLKEVIEGPYDDGNSGLAHAAQHAWNALARLERMLEEGEIEIRVGNDIKDGKPVLGTARNV